METTKPNMNMTRQHAEAKKKLPLNQRKKILLMTSRGTSEAHIDSRGGGGQEKKATQTLMSLFTKKKKTQPAHCAYSTIFQEAPLREDSNPVALFWNLYGIPF